MRLLVALLAGLVGMSLAGALVGQPLEVHLPRPARRTSWARRRRQWLRQAGLAVSPARFYLALTGLGLLAGGLVAVAVGAWVVGVPVGVAAAATPHLIYARRRHRRLQAIAKAWPDGLRDLAASAATGSTVHQAVLALARGGPPPLREAFARYGQLQRALGTTAALEQIREELADPTTDRVVELLVVAQRDRSRLAAICQQLAASVARDLRVAEEIDLLRREPLLDAYVAAAIPWALLVVLAVTSPPHRAFFSGPAGLLVAGLAGACTAGGVVGVRLLARDPGEARPLAGHRKE